MNVRYNEKCDAFSFAFVLLEVVLSDARYIRKKYPKQNAQCRGWRPQIPRYLESSQPKLAKLLAECWQLDFYERPNFKEVCKVLEECEEAAPSLGFIQHLYVPPAQGTADVDERETYTRSPRTEDQRFV